MKAPTASIFLALFLGACASTQKPEPKIKRAQPKPQEIQIQTSPPGALVDWNGNFLGVAPVTIELTPSFYHYASPLHLALKRSPHPTIPCPLARRSPEHRILRQQYPAAASHCNRLVKRRQLSRHLDHTRQEGTPDEDVAIRPNLAQRNRDAKKKRGMVDSTLKEIQPRLQRNHIMPWWGWHAVADPCHKRERVHSFLLRAFV